MVRATATFEKCGNTNVHVSSYVLHFVLNDLVDRLVAFQILEGLAFVFPEQGQSLVAHLENCLRIEWELSPTLTTGFNTSIHSNHRCCFIWELNVL